MLPETRSCRGLSLEFFLCVCVCAAGLFLLCFRSAVCQVSIRPQNKNRRKTKRKQKTRKKALSVIGITMERQISRSTTLKADLKERITVLCRYHKLEKKRKGEKRKMKGGKQASKHTKQPTNQVETSAQYSSRNLGISPFQAPTHRRIVAH